MPKGIGYGKKSTAERRRISGAAMTESERRRTLRKVKPKPKKKSIARKLFKGAAIGGAGAGIGRAARAISKGVKRRKK